MVSNTDVQQQVNKKCKLFAHQARVVLADWEKSWPQFKFNDVFSLFGVPMLQLDQKAESIDLDVEEANFDDKLLDETELSSLQAMRVVARLRPMLAHEEGDEITAEVQDEVTVSYETLHHGYVPARHTLQFDAALCCSQAELFQKSGVKALVHRACEGYTCSIFAYGQTGAGKTYSLFGPEDALSQLFDDDLSDEAQRQLPSACHVLVGEARRAQCGQQGALQFLFRVLKEMNLDGVCTTQSHIH